MANAVKLLSDKSSDSGGLLLDLSSRGISGSEETWLFAPNMKGLYLLISLHTNSLHALCVLNVVDMVLIEDERFPEDLEMRY